MCFLGSLWGSIEGSLRNLWGVSGAPLRALWKPLGGCLGAPWDTFGRSQGVPRRVPQRVPQKDPSPLHFNDKTCAFLHIFVPEGGLFELFRVGNWPTVAAKRAKIVFLALSILRFCAKRRRLRGPKPKVASLASIWLQFGFINLQFRYISSL